jgi:hypothetical protein
VARDKHKDEIINVQSDKCVEQVNKLPICDMKLLYVKMGDLENATKDISRISNDKTILR